MNGEVGIILALLLAAPVGYDAEQAQIVPPAVLEGDPVLTAQPESGADTNSDADGDANGSAAEDGAEDSAAPQLPTMKLFNALDEGGPNEEVDALVSAVATQLDMNCPRVSEYQVYRYSDRARTLKIKCVERPVYAVTLGPGGEAYVSGGDRTLGQMRIEDGPIRTVMGVRVEDYIANSREGPSLSETEKPVTRTIADRASRQWSSWLVWGLGLAVAAGIIGLFQRDRRRRKSEYARWRNLDSEAKNQLLEESEEIYPDVYRHPSGIFIARGRRGKRRLFPSLIFAYLYRSRSLKFFEIR